ncbi:SfnB family sulfur acquisition oxidoreductase [Aeromicrobium alkaliterrae]|uniref:SfnB family sulfur acquisition oxidoreductase n=1 Tax=Aeromicrobium alkaliterrae TaxID=302168 RepID=A0ABN2JVN7_9ACTN
MSDTAPTSVVDQVLAAVSELLPEIAASAAERDRTRSLPRYVLDLLSSAGAFSVTVPTTHGGPGGGAAVAFEVTRLLATADPNVAQIPQSHFVYLRLAELAGSASLLDELFGAVLTGERVANAQSERTGRTVTDQTTRMRLVDGATVVDGRKFYCTGSLTADWIAVLGRDEDDVEQVGFVRAGTSGLTIVDDWTGMGQRTTASGTITFEGVRVDPSHVVPRQRAVTGPHGYGAFAQGLHAAIDVGIARGALTEAAAFVRSSTRPWFEADVERAEQDPLLVQRFGELEVDVRAAESALVVAGAAVDAIASAPPSRVDDVAREASLQVAAAKVLGDRAALAVTSALFELGSTRSSDDGLNLHRHWRNARTHTLHDPVRWKLQHLGRWSVAGTPPPRGPQF